MAIAAVRPAVAADVGEIVRIQSLTWRAAYSEVVPAEALDQLAGEAAREAWTAAIAAGEGFHVLVATEGEWTVGFCAAAHYAGEGGALAEVSTLLVEPRWGRRGHGGRLLAHAVAALRSETRRYAAVTPTVTPLERGYAWIPEADDASLRFYARAGWEPDGAARTLDTGDGTLREIRVVGPLDLTLQD